MSRSRRKTAIIGVTTAPSDKPFKVDEHRAERHAVRAVVKRSLDCDDRALHSKVCGDPGNRRRMASRWSIRARSGCGNDYDGYVVVRDSQ